ncbi:cell division control protein 6 homolog [Coturnix japonica]|uniref:Cell division control protein n=1 Tax=Coturnix japonica TaxID=93934 RepID=A0A8C2ST23_COTJA|nr:cell division control protein 6 homolog [Coturnix japonica]
MSAARPQLQPTIAFPRRRSARCAAKIPPAAPGPTDPAVLRLSPPSPRGSALPLSPRKRLGDDNLCNVPHVTPCSPAKRCKENRGCRALFGDPAASPAKQNSPGPANPQHRQETPQGSRRSSGPTRSLFRQEGTCYQQAKRVLHVAVPERLHGREREVGTIRQFLRDHLAARRPGSLYIAGAPGTGKTACVSCVLRDGGDELSGSRSAVLNCMALSSAHAVFPAVAEQLGLPTAGAGGRELVRRLERQLTAKGPMLLLVLDEMDQLGSRAQDVLYTIFEWPRLPGSRLVLIGLANALDLTERLLARLHAPPLPAPHLLRFAPYSREQLGAILHGRLQQLQGGPVLEPSALQFCARKVSAVSGDARKALDVCRRAVELVELDVRSQTLLQPLPGGDPTAAPCPVPKRVGLPQVSRVLSEVFGDRMAPCSPGAGDAFPLQQKVLVCSLLLLTRHLRTRQVTLGKLHDAYSRVCRRQQLPAVDQAECLSLVTLLESRGVLELKRAKDTRLTKVSLKVEEEEAQHALQDATLVGSILARGLL